MTRFIIFSGFNGTEERGAEDIYTHADFIDDAVKLAREAVSEKFMEWAHVYDCCAQKICYQTDTDSLDFALLCRGDL